jgi:pimeloyl-ACP methyl ester carboxylesterase
MPVDPSSRMFFEAFGPENAPTIVFLHGGGAAGWMWREQVRALQSAYHCLLPDLPEQGRTKTGAGAYSTEGAADGIANLIRGQAHGQKAHVVGLSEGAQVTVALLSRNPQVVEHAVVSSAILRPLPGSGLYTPGLVAWSFRWFVAPFKNWNWWIRTNMKYAAGIPEEFYPEFKRSFQQQTEDGMVNMMISNLRFRLPAGLEKATAPTLVVVGSKEYGQMKESGRDLLKVLPNARGAMVNLGSEGSLASEHNWAMTDPELFTATLKAWIENKPLPEELKAFK